MCSSQSDTESETRDQEQANIDLCNSILNIDYKEVCSLFSDDYIKPDMKFMFYYGNFKLNYVQFAVMKYQGDKKQKQIIQELLQ